MKNLRGIGFSSGVKAGPARQTGCGGFSFPGRAACLPAPALREKGPDVLLKNQKNPVQTVPYCGKVW